MSEVNEHAQEQQEGEKLLALLTGSIRALELYELNNDAVQRLFRQIVEIVDAVAQRGRRGVVLQIEGENFFINQSLLRLDLKSFQRMDRLRDRLMRLDLNEIEIRDGVSADSLSLFFQNFTSASGDPESIEALADAEHTFVSVRKTAGITRKGRANEPWSKRSIRLHLTCQVLANDFVHRASQGRMPSTVSLRRVVQGLVDALDHTPDLLVALAHQGDARDGLSGHMVRSSVLAAAVARAAGLVPRLAGRAALVVFMSRLPLARLGDRWHAAPSEVLSNTFDSRLKEIMGNAGSGRVSAWRLVLLYEALMASLGNRMPYGDQLLTSFEGRIVEVSTSYDRIRAGLLSSGGRPNKPVSPSTAIRRLVAMVTQQDNAEQATLDAGLVVVLRKLVGDVPPGSLVKTPAGTFGVVRDRPGIVEIASADGRARTSFRKKDVQKVQPLEVPEGFDLSPALGWQMEQETEEEEEIDFSFD